MKRYEVQVDVAMGMRIEIEAKTQEEARQKIIEKQFTPSDLHNAWHVANYVVDISSIEE